MGACAFSAFQMGSPMQDAIRLTIFVELITDQRILDLLWHVWSLILAWSLISDKVDFWIDHE